MIIILSTLYRINLFYISGIHHDIVLKHYQIHPLCRCLFLTHIISCTKVLDNWHSLTQEEVSTIPSDQIFIQSWFENQLVYLADLHPQIQRMFDCP